MFCPACGRENPPNARFCGHCGEPQVPVHQTPSQPVPSIENVRTLTARLVDLSSQAMKLSPRKTQDWIGFLRKELMDLVLYFAALDRRISQREAQVYSDISNTVDPGLIEDPAGFLDGLMNACINTASPITLERPLLLDLMEESDGANKTSYAAEARRAFLQIASAVVWADGPPTGTASAGLNRYNTLLEPRSSAQEASAVIDAALSDTQRFPPVTEEVEAEPTKLELLAEQFQRFSESLLPAVAEEFNVNLPVDALILTTGFSRAAGRVTDGTAGFLLCVVNRVPRVRDALYIPGVLEDFRKTIRNDWKERSEPKVLLTIATLLKSDEASGSNYFEGGWNLFRELIDALAAEDQPPSKATADLQKRYRALLGYRQ
jgi:hypothetical protein